MGDTFVITETKLKDETMLVPGTDGNKMSKSRDNYINIFLPDKKLRKKIMSIQTDSKELEDPKDPDTCNVFAVYKLLANDSQIAEMRSNYVNGGFGYGHAKQALFELICDVFKTEREKYNHFMENPEEVDQILIAGAEKARTVASDVLKRVRKKVGY